MYDYTMLHYHTLHEEDPVALGAVLRLDDEGLLRPRLRRLLK